MVDGITEIGRESARIGSPERSLLEPTLREDDGDEGFVACVDTGAHHLPAPDLFERIERFGRSMDLADVGDFRYVFARSFGERTHFIALWTDGSFSVSRMFPGSGDAPGRDAPGIPRPPDARRALSFYEADVPQTMTMYVGSPKSPAELADYYREALGDERWELLNEEARENQTTLVYERGTRLVTVVLARDMQGKGAATILTADP
jgi:hypothetical protein